MYREKKPEKQAKFDLLFTDLEKAVSESRSDYSHFKDVLETQLKSINQSENNYFRMVHSIIAVLGQKKLPIDQPDVLANWLFYYFRTLNCEINPPYATQMVKTMESYVKSVDPTDENDVRVRNICLALSILLSRMYWKDKKIKKFFTNKIATFVKNVVFHNSKYSQLFALVCLTLFCEVDELKACLSNQINLQTVLRQLSSTVEEFKNLESLYNPEHILRYRIGTLAQWMLDHDFCVDESLQVKDCITAIKLLTVSTYRIKITRDNYSAFGCDRMWQDYQCSQSIDPKNGDVFYYEAILLTPGSIWLGWALKIKKWSAVFPTKESISYNAYQKNIRVCGVFENYDLPSIKPCDVVGCLLDTSAGAFKFFLNGNEIPHTLTLPEYKLDLSSEPYYPTACVSAYQQVYFNFGQAPFRFAPSDVKFRDICGQVHVTLEEKFNLWVSNLEKTISERCFGYSYFKEVFETPLLSEMADKKCFSRLVHSTVNVLGQLPTDNPEVLAFWLYHSFDVLKRKIDPPDAEEMRQILETHMKAVNERNSYDVQVCNISMLLAILISKIYTKKEELKTLFHDTVAKFVEDVVKYNSSYAQLFALICLETYSTVNELNAPNHLHLKETLAQLSETSLEKCRAQSDEDVLPSRIGEYSQWLLDNVFNDDNKSMQIKEDSTIIKLCTTKDHRIIFTRDNYSAFGCDCLWQDYQCSHGIDPASGDVFYYEATLLTRGSIYIGWALKLDFEKYSNEFPSKKSVSLNVFNKQNVKAFGLASSFDLPFPIKPCDVVGCLLDTSDGTFKFYLNGSEIVHSFTLPEYKLEMPSTGELYYPTACLSLYQHVYFNFGQVPFRFAPTHVKFCTVLDVFNTPQEKFDSWIFKLEKTVSESCLDESYFKSAFETPLKEMIVKSGKKGVFRLAHSTVNVLGQKKLSTDQPDKLTCLLRDYFGRTRLWLGFVAFPVTEMAKILETHMEAVDPTDKQNDVRVRNISMLLWIIPSTHYNTFKEESKALFIKKIIAFVEDVVIHNCNYAQLFALMCLEKFYEVEEIKSFKQLNLEVVLHRLTQVVNEFNLESLYNREQSYVLGYRIGVYAQWLLDNVFGDGNSKTNDCPIELLTDEKFDSKKKVSRDNFYVFENFNSRKDYQCSQGIDLQSGDVFYYEVVLITPGSIDIGWALKVDFKLAFYYVNFFEKFISFNAFRKKIMNCGKIGSFDLPPIKPCDVVGCLLDTSAGAFKFYLNGNEIAHTFTVPMNMTSEHFYPTVCLSSYQQVYFNFGQAPFRFAPSDLKVRTIWEVSNTLEERFNRWIIDLEKAARKRLDSSEFDLLTSSLEDMAVKSGEKFAPLLAQTIIAQLGQEIFSVFLLHSFAFLLFRHLTSVLKSELIIFPDAAQMAQILEIYLEAVDPKNIMDIRVRNICLLLTILAFGFYYNDEKELKALFTEKIVSFVGDVVAHNCGYTQLFALMSLEKFYLEDALKSNLVVVLQGLSQAVEEFEPESVYNSDYMTILNIQRFRNGAYAQWLLDHVFGDESLQIQDCPIKLLTDEKVEHRKKVTRDNLSAFGCDNLWQNYQCSQGIDPQSGDLSYYEAILFTKGSIYVGWALKLDFTQDYAAFYEDKDSISFESLGKMIRAYDEENSCDLPAVSFKLCDVVGCLLDTSAGTFKFYLNGIEIAHTFAQPNYKMNMTSGHYYPTVCLAAYQQMYFNFGQAPFRFAPSDLNVRAICAKVINSIDVADSRNEKFGPVKSFAQISMNQIPLTNIECEKNSLEVVDAEQDKWREWIMKISVIMREYECGGKAMVTSLIQSVDIKESEESLKVQASINKFNAWIRKLELKVREDVMVEEKFDADLRKSLFELVKSEEDWIKLVRSMITEMAASSDDRVDVMAMWMMRYIKLLMPPKPDKVMKLIKPYLKSYVNENVAVSNGVSSQLRNICILLSIMPRVYQYEKKLKVFLTSKIINVLVKLVSLTNQHKSSKLYALFCMQSFAKSCPQMKGLLEKNQFKREDIETFLQVQITESTSNSRDYDLCQIKLLSVWLLDYVFGKDNLESISSKTTSGASTKMSHDGMSAAGFYYYDWIDYSYQSAIRVRPVSCSVYFYEAILMTSGSARVGWALSSEDRKGNAQCSSIFFDACQKCIYLDGKPHPIEKSLKQPKPGTVIGCLLDTASKIFYFYLDGDLVPVSEVKLCLSAKPYLLTVSLAAYQHVFLNLGPSSFKYPLK